MKTVLLPRNLAALSVFYLSVLCYCLMTVGLSSCGQKTPPPSSAPPEYQAFLKQFDSLDVGRFEIQPKDFHRLLKAMTRSDAEQFLRITNKEWGARTSTRHPFNKGSAFNKDDVFEYFGKFTCIPTVDVCIVRSHEPNDTVFILTTFDKTTGKPIDSQVIAESSTELGGEDEESPVQQMTTAEIAGFDYERAQEEGWQNAALHVTTTLVLQQDDKCNEPQHVFYIRPDGVIEDHTLFVGSILGAGDLKGYTAAETDIVPDINADIHQYAGSYSFEYTYNRSRGGFTVSVSGDSLRVLYEETNGRLNHSQTMQEFANVLFGFNRKDGILLIRHYTD